MNTIKWLIAASFILLSGCSTIIPTGYWKMNYSNTGYIETKVGQNIYFLEYAASIVTPKAAVKEMWEKRAKELCGSEYSIEDYKQLTPMYKCTGDQRCRRVVSSAFLSCKPNGK